MIECELVEPRLYAPLFCVLLSVYVGMKTLYSVYVITRC